MPIYEGEGELTREDLLALRKKNRCKECGASLNVYLDPDSGKAFIACWHWHRSHHEGIERGASRYEKEGVAALNIPARREIMVEEHGEEKTAALVKYISTGAITKAIATEIVETLWGEAPLIEKTKAILLCQTYQLNPLMKHLYLVGYRRKDKDGNFIVDKDGNYVKDWSIQIGIGATRLMAQRKHNYSYLDLSPRKATEEEIKQILGDTANPNSIYGFTHIKDVDTRAEAFGLRGIPKNERIKGEEKGNTQLNMACVRSERLALDRQYPGEMPPNVEVVDERYMDAEYKVVGQEPLNRPEGDETIGAQADKIKPEQDKGQQQGKSAAEEVKKQKQGATNFSSQKGKKPQKIEPPAAEPKSPDDVTEDDIPDFNALCRLCFHFWKMQPEALVKDLGYKNMMDVTLSGILPWDAWLTIKELKK